MSELATKWATSEVLDSETYSEAAAVELVLAKIPPIKTCGSTWYAYESGVWRPVTSHAYRPVVLGVLAEDIRTNRKVEQVLRHIESQQQVAESTLRGVCYTDENGDILVSVENGVLQLSASGKVRLSVHAPAHNFTRQVGTAYDSRAECPIFRRVLKEALPDKADRFLLRLFGGSLLLPSCRYEAALVCYGPGGTGKSTIAEAVAGTLGCELVERVGLSNLCDPRSFYITKLKHAAVNLGTELDALEVGESGNFKALVSGEAITARGIYSAPETFATTAKLWFLSNSLPRFKHGTDAEQRRKRFLRFVEEPQHRDPELKGKLLGECEGILAWCVRGLVALVKLGSMPMGGEASRQVHTRFGISNDPLGAFIESKCVLNPSGQVDKLDFENAMKDFCECHGIPAEKPAWSYRQLWERFPQLGEVY